MVEKLVIKPYRQLHGRIVASGYSCADIAKKLNISAQAMSQKMQMKSYFTTLELARLGEILHLTPDEYYTLLIRPILEERNLA